MDILEQQLIKVLQHIGYKERRGCPFCENVNSYLDICYLSNIDLLQINCIGCGEALWTQGKGWVPELKRIVEAEL